MTGPAQLVTPATVPLAVRVRRVAGAPLVSLRAWLRGGSRVERIPGLALVTGRMLTEGTARRDWRAIAAEAENRGAAISSSGSNDVHGLSIDGLSNDWELAVDWAAELVREPAFPPDRLEWILRQTAAELDSLADQADVVAGWAFLEQLYHPHPRSYPLQGDRTSLARITPADCAAHHAAALAAGLQVVITGDIDEGAVERRLAERFADLPLLAAAEPEPAPPRGLEAMRRAVGTPAHDQAHLFVGHLSVPRGHDDYAALQVIGVALGSGAGLTGRIPQRIREREGLAYTAYALTAAGAGFDSGRLVAYVGTSPATVEQAERGVREELERLLADGLTSTEVEESRAYLLGRDPFRRETARQWAELLADSMLYGTRGDDPAWVEERFRAVDLEAANAAIQRHVRPTELRVTVGLPEAD